MAHLAPARHGHHNLPLQVTPLVGRDQDVASLCPLMLEHEGRLVTLTGVGGCGKTRLAVGVGSTLVGSFRDGVWLVSLSPLADPLLVPQVVASVLGVRERLDRSLLPALVAHLGKRQLLLVLDNCEHLLQGCVELAETLLHGCPGVRLLATSREPLHITGERAWRVPPLAIPDLRSISGPDVIRYAAVELFVERAVAACSDFAVTPRNAPVVATICARLEGLPLAIELAAPWVRALGVDQILERLDDAVGLLVDGSRSAPNRQRTMRATLDWSYGLLAETERVVLQRLAVFVGGWSLEAAEVVCSGSGVAPPEVLSLLTRLVDASLVQVEQQDGRARYRLLEPVRHYAHAGLMASGELDAVRRQHADFFLSFAQHWETDANVGGPGRQAAHAALDQEQDNLRAAMGWCLEQGEAEKGLSLSKAHWNFWVVRGLLTEGRGWLTRLIALPGAAEAPTLRDVALTMSATLAFRQGSYDTTLEMYREVLPRLRQADNPFVLECALMDLGFIAMHQGDYEAARRHWGESLRAACAAGHRINEALASIGSGWVALLEADYSTARAWCEKGLALSRSVADNWAVSISLTVLGHVLVQQGDLTAARRILEEGVVLHRQIGERFVLAESLHGLGQLATVEKRYMEARAALLESLRLRQDMGDPSGSADTLESIAELAAADGQPERAVQLAGAAARVREAVGARQSQRGRAGLDRWLVPLQQLLGVEVTTLAWEAGRAASVEQAMELAHAPTEAPFSGSNRPPDRSGHRVTELTSRQQEVAVLVARGLTNRQIAERLVVTEGAAAKHVEHILDKLGVGTRAQIAAWAAERGLVTTRSD